VFKQRRSLFLAILVLSGFPFFGGCSTGHDTLRGSVLMKLDEVAHICVGSDDGIRVGDILLVYRIRVENQ